MKTKIMCSCLVLFLLVQLFVPALESEAASNAVSYNQVYIRDNYTVREYLTEDIFLEDTGYIPGNSMNYTNMVLAKGTYVGKTTI